MQPKLVFWSVVSGILASLPWYGLGLLPLFIAFVPLFYLNYYLLKRKAVSSLADFWPYALIASLVWHFAAAWWGVKVSFVGAVSALIIYAFMVSVVWQLFHIAHRLKGEKFAALFLVFAWLSLEYLQFNWELSWPWLNLGNGFANYILFIQWFEFTGVMGGSLWILLVNIMVWRLFRHHFIEHLPIKIKLFIPLFVVVALPIIVSVYIFKTYSEEENSFTVSLLQPNIDPYTEKFDGIEFSEQYRILIDLAENAPSGKVQLFVAPETALHNVYLNNIHEHEAIPAIKQLLVHNAGAAFIVGATSILNYDETDVVPYTARYSTDSLYNYDVFNSALFISEHDSIGVYHKSKLVAGVEKMPFKKHLRFVDKLSVNLGGTTGSLATDFKRHLFYHNGAVIAVPICYESVYGDYLARFVREGANLIVVITNDGWWDKTPGYRQHLSYARLRAIEFRRPVARSANTGISCFINQRGEIVAKTEWWQQASLTQSVNLNSKLTIYAQHGDYLARISLFMFILMSLSMLVSYLRKGNFF